MSVTRLGGGDMLERRLVNRMHGYRDTSFSKASRAGPGRVGSGLAGTPKLIFYVIPDRLASHSLVIISGKYVLTIRLLAFPLYLFPNSLPSPSGTFSTPIIPWKPR